MFEISCNNEQKVRVTLAPVTVHGKPAKLDGPPSWQSISGDATVEVDANGLSAVLTSSDAPGDTDFAIEGDGDLGAGVVTIREVIRLRVVSANAENLGITASLPEPK